MCCDYKLVQRGNKAFDEHICRLIDSLNLYNPSILDVGCGSGYNAFLLRCFFPDSIIHGLDIDLSKTARPLYDKVIEYDLYDLPLELPEKYDVVLCTEVLEHFPKRHSLRLRKELCELADQLVIFSVPNKQYNLRGDHLSTWFKRDFEGYNVRVIRYRTFPRSLYPFEWFRRKIFRLYTDHIFSWKYLYV